MENLSIQLHHPSKTLSGTVQLTGSKSESNRALIIQALAGADVQVQNLSSAADTDTLQKSLKKVRAQSANTERVVIDIGPAGTAMRFLTAYLATVNGNFILTGSERMKQRPIGILADALITLGANVSYTGVAGFPPLEISGGFTQKNDSVTVNGNISSQYLSALLLIASSLPNGLTLRIDGELTSRPYLKMTLAMLNEVGIKHNWQGDTISIGKQRAQPSTITIEPDWSAASYWYAIAALSNRADLLLPNLKSSSLQGDAAIVDIMSHFGVVSSFESGGLRIQKTGNVSQPEKKSFDFNSCPDLAQTVITCAAALRWDMSFTGLHTLRIKETDRIAALQNELAKFGVALVEDGDTCHLRTAGFFQPEKISIDTYEDHRMAMAFAPLALVLDRLEIHEPAVVDKSYPDFWKHLKQHGFILS